VATARDIGSPTGRGGLALEDFRTCPPTLWTSLDGSIPFAPSLASFGDGRRLCAAGGRSFGGLATVHAPRASPPPILLPTLLCSPGDNAAAPRCVCALPTAVPPRAAASGVTLLQRGRGHAASRGRALDAEILAASNAVGGAPGGGAPGTAMRAAPTVPPPAPASEAVCIVVKVLGHGANTPAVSPRSVSRT